RLRRPAQAAVNCIVQAQHEQGGWRYTPKQPGDTSVTGWQLQALWTAKHAGLEAPERTFKLAVQPLGSCCGAGVGGAAGGPRSAPSREAVGRLCRQRLESWGPQNPRLLKGAENWITKNPPGTVKNLYYEYYATQVMQGVGGEAWKKWQAQMRDELLRRQDQGTQRKELGGSWSPVGDPHAGAGGRLMITSLALLILEAPDRPLAVRRGKDPDPPAERDGPPAPGRARGPPTPRRWPTRTIRPSLRGRLAFGWVIFSRSGPTVTAPPSTERRASLLLLASPARTSSRATQRLPLLHSA